MNINASFTKLKSHQPSLLIAILCLGLSGCLNFASRSYEDTEKNFVELQPDSHDIDHIKPVDITVDSRQSWQNSNVFLQAGDVVTVNSHGNWSLWPEVNIWNGPEGTVLAAGEVDWITGGALMARIGHKGRPFELGVEKTFKAKDYGMLYMAMNDFTNHLNNNKGSVEAKVYVDRNKQLASEQGTTGQSHKVTAFQYDDRTQKGSISATVGSESFVVRQWLLEKIGEISSSKNIALQASKNRSDGGAYRVMDEKISDGVLTIWFETVF